MPLETRTGGRRATDALLPASVGKARRAGGGGGEGSSSGRVPGPFSVAGQSSVYEQKERQGDGDTATRTSRCTIAHRPSPVARRSLALPPSPSPAAAAPPTCYSSSHCRDSNDLLGVTHELHGG